MKKNPGCSFMAYKRVVKTKNYTLPETARRSAENISSTQNRRGGHREQMARRQSKVAQGKAWQCEAKQGEAEMTDIIISCLHSHLLALSLGRAAGSAGLLASITTTSWPSS